MRHQRRLLTRVTRAALGLTLLLLFFPSCAGQAQSPAAIQPAPPPTGEPAGEQRARQLAEDALFLTEAGGVAQGDLYQGASVTVVEEKDGWVKVSVTGWVSKSSLAPPTRPEEKAPGATPSPAEAGPSAMGAEEGFRFKNVAFRPTYGFTKVVGEVQNLTPSSYSVATFTLTVYDASGAIVAVDHLVVSNLKPFGTKTFEALLDAALPEDITYKIQFDAAF